MLDKVIEIRSLSYSYPDQTKALENINIAVARGESLGIVGPNGAGKSTLLLHLNGILKGNGQVKVLGLEMKQENFSQIRSKVGLVFQDPDSQLFMPTVFDDVAFGPVNMGLSKEEIKKNVQGALQEVDMGSASKRLSHHLSFGEKKRISIATVLSMNPEILVLDEPTSNLDPKHRRQLILLLKKLNLTTIIATHDLELVWELCSNVVLLDKGKLIKSGAAKDVLKDKDLLEAHGLEIPRCFV